MYITKVSGFAVMVLWNDKTLTIYDACDVKAAISIHESICQSFAENYQVREPLGPNDTRDVFYNGEHVCSVATVNTFNNSVDVHSYSVREGRPI